MTLIDRYIHEVGRHLPRKNRSDIQVELRSLLTDSLEDRAGADATEADMTALLKEFGAPRKVAASYYPEGQYLIGPSLYPLFRLVAGIALAAVFGAQLLAWAVSAIVTEEPFSLLQALSGLLNSIPTALGMVVIVFAILQWFEIRLEEDETSWDPSELPQLVTAEPVKRGERIFGIIVAIIILAILPILQGKVGFVSTPGGELFVNPVIGRYIVWISASLLAGIGLDVYLVWQGHWQTISRIVRIGANVFSIIILYALVQGHSAWLAERGASGFFTALADLSQDISHGGQILGMQLFRMSFAIAAIVITVETVVMIVRLAVASVSRDPRTKAMHIQKA